MSERRTKKQCESSPTATNDIINIIRPNLKVASILDEFSYECFKYECKLIPLGIHDWRTTLIQENPDLLLVESAWEGNDKAWKFRIANYNQFHISKINKLIQSCKIRNIPTVFWNKEDPIYFDRFIETAKLFDYIFTTDADSISRYKKIVKHNNVYVLSFASQPKIHNPIDKDKEKLGKVAFAGTYHNNKFLQRKKDMKVILKPAIQYGLHIYDRMHHRSKSDKFKFPDIYQPHIRGSLPYKQITEMYKKYDVFLNVNIIHKSPTMFSRRIFELLACGTNVISAYSVGIKSIFPEVVKLCKSQDDTKKHLDTLLSDKELRDRLSLLGQRKVFNKHTYSHRIETILKKLDLRDKIIDTPGVSIITCTNRLGYMDKVLNNYKRQSYRKKELIVILNNNNMNLQEWRKKVKQYKNIKVFQVNEQRSLDECLNVAIEQISFDYVSIFDDDNYYGADFIGDLTNCFKYTDAGVVGKHTYYTYIEESRTLAIKFPNMENRYVQFLSDSALIIKSEVLDKIPFRHKIVKTLAYFLKDCTENNIKLYSSDRFNYVCIKHPWIDDHTQEIENEEYLRDCQIVGYTDNFIIDTTV